MPRLCGLAVVSLGLLSAATTAPQIAALLTLRDSQYFYDCFARVLHSSSFSFLLLSFSMLHFVLAGC